MKMKHALVYLAVGYCFDFIGGLFKVEHWQYADYLLTTATVFQVVGMLLVIIKLLTHPKAKEVLNW